jgi:hypothetical protein
MLAGLAAVLAVAGLAGCRTSPNVAAYVDDEQITVDRLESAVDERLADDDIAAYAKGHEDGYTKQVLSLLIGEQVYDAAAEHWDVTVSDREIRDRIDTLLAGRDPDDAFSQVAQSQGANREDVFENVREQLLRQKIARAEGLDDPLSEAALRQQYEQTRDQYAQLDFGYIAVPDQATADAVLAALTADPTSYATVAAGYNNGVTLLQPETRPADQLPQVLSQQLLATQPGQGFTVPVQDLGVVVAFVTGVTYQPFEDVRADLEDAAAGQVDQKAVQLVRDFRDTLTITPNPRYGTLQLDDSTSDVGLLSITEDDCGVVRPVDAKTNCDAPSGTGG